MSNINKTARRLEEMEERSQHLGPINFGKRSRKTRTNPNACCKGKTCTISGGKKRRRTKRKSRRTKRKN